MLSRTLAALAATLLAACATVPAAPPPPIPEKPVDSAPARFAEQIAEFAAEDRVALRPPCQIVFTGSSSIRLWETLGQDLAPLPVLNRGFGGSQISDVNHYFEPVVAKYRPAAVVLYAGENDLAAGERPEAVVADVLAFMSLKDRAIPAAHVYFVSLKPSKLRWAHFAAQSWINDRIRELAERRADLTFIDVVEPMLENGQPRDIYVEDELHMAPAGYAIWTHAIKPVLEADLADLQTACRR